MWTATSGSSPGHAPLLVQLAIGPLQIQEEDGAWLKAVVDGGFLHVSTEEGATRVDVLATNAQLEAEIDVDVARRRLEELRSAAAEDDEHAKTEIARAEARIALTGSGGRNGRGAPAVRCPAWTASS